MSEASTESRGVQTVACDESHLIAIAPVASDNAEGFTFRWEYSGTFPSLNAGTNVIAVALEDHGGATAFDMEAFSPLRRRPGAGASCLWLARSLLGPAGL